MWTLYEATKCPFRTVQIQLRQSPRIHPLNEGQFVASNKASGACSSNQDWTQDTRQSYQTHKPKIYDIDQSLLKETFLSKPWFSVLTTDH